MPIIHYVQPDGQTQSIDVEEGLSVMEGARLNGVEGVTAECGGGALCATCHVIVDEGWIERTGRATGTETVLLELAPGRTETSRLSCQIEIDDGLDGLIVRIPAEQLAG